MATTQSSRMAYQKTIYYPSTFKLELDPSLGRGDFTIDMGGVIQTIKYKKVIE